MKSIIVGYGEIGKSLYNVLRTNYDVGYIDRHTEYNAEGAEIIHICIPYSDKFIEQVKEYQTRFNPKYTVVHSTTPVGTTRQLNAIHSPCLGIHPHLEESMRVFPKYLGGKQASEVANYFRRAGLKVYLFDKSETTELLKILDTTLYGVCIEYTKDVKRQCDKYEVPFEAWTVYNNFYNEGYKRLNYPEFVRPNLIPIMQKPGGHCILPNLELLDTPFTKFLKELNA
jgi:hypothetical protein